MLRRRNIILLTGVVCVVAGIVAVYLYQEYIPSPVQDSALSKTEREVPLDVPGGGGCSYNHFPGICTITSIDPATNPFNPKEVYRDSYENVPGLEVHFTFRPSANSFLKGVPEHYTKQIYSLYPGATDIVGPKFIKTFGLYPGEKYACTMSIETRGTCTPVSVDFDKLTDKALKTYYDPFIEEHIKALQEENKSF